MKKSHSIKGTALVTILFLSQSVLGLNITRRPIDDDLFRAIEGNDAPTIEALLKKGADPDAEVLLNVNSVTAGDTLWAMALQRSTPEIIALIKKHRKPGKPLSLQSQALVFQAALYTIQTGNPHYSLDRVKLLVENGLDVNAINLGDLTNKIRRGGDGQSPLMMAAGKNEPEIVAYLLARGAKVNQRTRTGENVLFFARQGDMVRALLRAGADPSAVNQYGQTALQEAIRQGLPEVSAALLEKAPDSTKKDLTPALLAACRPQPPRPGAGTASPSLEIIKNLLDHGADPNGVVENQGWKTTPLLEAVRFNHGAAVALLLKAGAIPRNTTNGKGSLLELAVQQEDPEITRMLWPHYAPLSEAEKASLAGVALQYGKPSSLEVLSKYGLDLAKRKTDRGIDQGAEGLVHAVSNQKREMVEALLKQGVDINATGYNETPLTAALRNNDMELVELLIRKGADVNKPDKSGATPLGAAVGNANLEMYRFLKLKGARAAPRGTPLLHLSVLAIAQPNIIDRDQKDGSMEILRDLLADGHSADSLDPEGFTPLWRLSGLLPTDANAGPKWSTAAKLLIKNGAKVDAVPANCGDAPPPAAPGARRAPSPPDAVREAASDRFVSSAGLWSYRCRTPLLNAAVAGNRAILEVLLEAGANANWQSPGEGLTPLMAAALQGDPNTVSLLLAKGADPLKRNAEGKTAADLARARGNTKALALLSAGRGR